MSILNLLHTSVTLVQRTEGAVSDNGEPTVTETTLTTVGHLAQQTTGEDGTGIVTEQLRLFLPADTPVEAWDAVTVGAFTYEVDGTPWAAVNARTGNVSHVELTLKRAT